MVKQYCNVARYKNHIYVREIVDGVERNRKVKYKPYLFQRTNKKTEHRDFYDRFYLEKVRFETPYEMKEFLDSYSQIPDEIWGNTDIVSQFIHEEGYASHADTSKIIRSYVDIEVNSLYQDSEGNWIDGGFPNQDDAKFPINAICEYRSDDKKYHIFTTAKGWDVTKSQLKYAEAVDYHSFDTEEQLLKAWMRFWCRKYPHITSGWNNKTFDIVYIINRIRILFGQDVVNCLSPWGVVDIKTTHDKFGKQSNVYSILGISIIDYMDLYKKYRNKPREKYTLMYISKVENPDEHKIEFTGNHNTLFRDNPALFADYNIQDVRCCTNFDVKFQFMDMIIYLAYYAGVNFEDTFSPLKIWDTHIYREAEKQGYIIPIKGESSPKDSYEGAYVHEPVPGLKGAICSFDFTSLYPNLMILFYIGADVHVTGERKASLRKALIELMEKNRDTCGKMLDELQLTGIFNEFYIYNDIPEVVTEFLKRNKVALTTNVEFYDVSRKSVFVDLIQLLFKERKENKKESAIHKQNAKEIRNELKERGTSEKYSKYSTDELQKMLAEELHLAEVFNVLQLVKKILLNSLYGAVGNNFFRYYNKDMARSITLMGQCMINKAAIKKNEYISKILKESEVVDRRAYSDTDSNYMDMTDILNKFYEISPDADRNAATDFMDKFCKDIESNCLQPVFDKVKYECNGFSGGGLHMDREAICIPYKKTGHSAIWTAKKRYIAMVSDMEDFRYDEPHKKIMGMFSVTSSCPEFIKPVFDQTLIELIKEGPDSARKVISDFKNVFFSKTIEEISFPKSVSDVTKFTDPKTMLPWSGKWFDSVAGKERNGGIPINANAAICYNYLVRKLNIQNKYQYIKDGDKMKYAYLNQNQYGFSVIGFIDTLPEEFELNDFVSYETHWEKLFYSPINDVFEACGLSIEKFGRIDDFF